jgi:hypothetical protein
VALVESRLTVVRVAVAVVLRASSAAQRRSPSQQVAPVAVVAIAEPLRQMVVLVVPVVAQVDLQEQLVALTAPELAVHRLLAVPVEPAVTTVQPEPH